MVNMCGIGAGQCEDIGSGEIVGDGDIGDLGCGGGIEVLGEGGDGVTQHHGWRRVDVGDTDGQRRGVIGSAGDGGIVDVDGDIEARVGIEIQHGAGDQEQLVADDGEHVRHRCRTV